MIKDLIRSLAHSAAKIISDFSTHEVRLSRKLCLRGNHTVITYRNRDHRPCRAGGLAIQRVRAASGEVLVGLSHEGWRGKELVRIGSNPSQILEPGIQL